MLARLFALAASGESKPSIDHYPIEYDVMGYDAYLKGASTKEILYSIYEVQTITLTSDVSLLNSWDVRRASPSSMNGMLDEKGLRTSLWECMNQQQTMVVGLTIAFEGRKRTVLVHAGWEAISRQRRDVILGYISVPGWGFVLKQL